MTMGCTVVAHGPIHLRGCTLTGGHAPIDGYADLTVMPTCRLGAGGVRGFTR
jgi:hypothetical protein